MPDEAANDDLSCPLCNYSLRGLETPRCPECGYAFDWEELRRSIREQHPYLFEHHPKANVWSFFATLIHGVRPIKFWKSVQPGCRIRRRRMVLYAVLILLPMLGVTAGLELKTYWDSFATVNPYPNRSYLWLGPPAYQFSLSEMLSLSSIWQLSALILAWPILTIATLMIFTTTMSRANLGVAHVERCVLYSFDVYMTPLIVLTALMWNYGSYPPWETTFFRSGWLLSIRYGSGLLPFTLIGWVVTYAWMTCKLVAAYQHYLRFPHALGVVLSSQVIVWMVVTLACLFFTLV